RVNVNSHHVDGDELPELTRHFQGLLARIEVKRNDEPVFDVERHGTSSLAGFGLLLSVRAHRFPWSARAAAGGSFRDRRKAPEELPGLSFQGRAQRLSRGRTHGYRRAARRR